MTERSEETTSYPPTVCTCGPSCNCYFVDRKVIGQRMEDDPNTPDEYDDEGLIVAGSVCVVIYETGEEQRLIRPWMDLSARIK